MHGKTWLPANDLSLTESWSQTPPNFVVGEPITRTLTLKADGLTAAQLPSMAMGDSNNFKAYPDQPRLNDKIGSAGISGTRQEKIALIPTRAGEITLPAIEIEWWNLNGKQMEVAKLPARVVTVAPAANVAANTTPATPQVLSQAPAPVAVENTGKVQEAIVSNADQNHWRYISIFLGLAW